MEKIIFCNLDMLKPELNKEDYIGYDFLNFDFKRFMKNVEYL